MTETTTVLVDEARTILEEAQRIVHGARRDHYGHPLDNHGRTAGFWTVYLGREITPEDVCFMNILQKISRNMNLATPDNLVDIAGYAANVEMVQDERTRRGG